MGKNVFDFYITNLFFFLPTKLYNLENIHFEKKVYSKGLGPKASVYLELC